MRRPASVHDFSTVTEIPGTAVTAEQLAMNFHRYHTVSPYCEMKDVLEVGCGAGQGLGYLEKRARHVIGGDITENLLRAAQSYYKGRVPLVRMDAQEIPFRDDSFDVVILFEAIYYLSDPDRFVRESRRVLREGGLLAVCAVNKEWRDFNPSPFCTRYFSARELKLLLTDQGMDVSCYAAFPCPPKTLRNEALSSLKMAAVSLGLMPKTMKRKRWLKRIFFGRLHRLGDEVTEGMAVYVPPVSISGDAALPNHKILYVLGWKRRMQKGFDLLQTDR